MSNAKHVSPPWHYFEEKSTVCVAVHGKNGFLELGTFYDSASAKFAVKAVNCHGDLLAACQTISRAQSWPGDDPRWVEAFADVRAAIAKATGQ